MDRLNHGEKKYIRRYLYTLGIILFCAYIGFLLWRVFFYAYGGYHRTPGGMIGYNLVPFKTIAGYIKNYQFLNREIWFLNLFGNVLAFMPFGFLFPIIFRGVRRLKYISVATGVFSLLIEMVQFALGVGTFDVDDVILNTMGGVLGYLIFRIFLDLFFKWTNREK